MDEWTEERSSRCNHIPLYRCAERRIRRRFRCASCGKEFSQDEATEHLLQLVATVIGESRSLGYKYNDLHLAYTNMGVELGRLRAKLDSDYLGREALRVEIAHVGAQLLEHCAPQKKKGGTKG